MKIFTLRDFKLEVVATTFVAGASLLLLAVAGASWAPGGVPSLPGGDFLFHGAQIKSIQELGWFPRPNPLLGAPFGQEPYDFPTSDSLSVAIFRLLALCLNDWRDIAIAYFVLGFPIIAAISYLALRSMAVSRPWASAGALIFAFLPFHFLRIPHLLLSTYLTVPIGIWLAWVVPQYSGSASRFIASWPGKLSVLGAALLGCGGIYFAFFGVVLLAFSGAFFSLRAGSIRPLALAVAAITVVTLSVACNLLPTWTYAQTHGPNALALPGRDLATTEANSLKPIQLFLPTPMHRIAGLRNLELRYASTAPLVAENRSASLGFSGAVGLCVLLLYPVLMLATRVRSIPLTIAWSSTMALAILALSVVGGFNSVIALSMTAYIRGWNRISVFLGFFCIAGLVVFLDRLCASSIEAKQGRVRTSVLLASPVILALIAVFDQTPLSSTQNTFAQEASDRQFFAEVGHLLPPRSLVFQLPYWPFPEGGAFHQWQDYSHLRGYLYTSTIGWSYGGMKGREADLWYRLVSLLPPARFVQFLGEHGFSAIYVDRLGYEDGGTAIVSELTKILGAPAVLSARGDLAVFVLHPSAHSSASFDGLARLAAGGIEGTERGACNIDLADNRPIEHGRVLGEKRYVQVAGWVADGKSVGAPHRATLELTQGQRVWNSEIWIGTSRPDIASALGSPAFLTSGFVGLIPVGDLPSGDFSIRIAYTDSRGDGRCSTRFVLAKSTARGGTLRD